jgi:uncharacterized membrane protein
LGEILNRMNQEKMIKMLEAFDQELNRPLRLIIKGASALIINGAITRPSKDIDVLGASEDINKDPYPKIIEKIAREYSLDHQWINERAKITFDYVISRILSLYREILNISNLISYLKQIRLLPNSPSMIISVPGIFRI